MRRLRGTEGASAVEFALVLPVLITLLFGTMYGASLFNSQQTVTQGAREGARFGSTLPRDADDPSDWEDDVEMRVQQFLDADRPLTSGATSICVRFYPESGSPLDNGADACSAASTSDIGERVEVRVTRQARLELGITSIDDITLSASSVAMYEVN